MYHQTVLTLGGYGAASRLNKYRDLPNYRTSRPIKFGVCTDAGRNSNIMSDFWFAIFRHWAPPLGTATGHRHWAPPLSTTIGHRHWTIPEWNKSSLVRPARSWYFDIILLFLYIKTRVCVFIFQDGWFFLDYSTLEDEDVGQQSRNDTASYSQKMWILRNIAEVTSRLTLAL
jgi:hypothetical protein